jgi:RNA polymerase sigma-70 factor (ECF subfamily)
MSAFLVDRADLATLVDRARAGDVDAFGELYDLHQGPVYRMLLKQTRSHALAEDLTSETFFRALRNLPSSNVRGDYVTAWLLRIARNLAVDYFKAKHNRYEVSVDPHDNLGGREEVVDSPESEVITSLGSSALLRAVGDLPANQRTCLTARFVDDLSIAETARLMRCSEGAVKQLQYRGIRNLAARIRPGAA